MSTFMNAMTAADYTCYPFATMNSTDYFNLLGVYLDAVFSSSRAKISCRRAIVWSLRRKTTKQARSR